MVRVGVGGVATGIALYVLSFLTFVGNAMVLHAIRTEKRLQTVSEELRCSLLWPRGRRRRRFANRFRGGLASKLDRGDCMPTFLKVAEHSSIQQRKSIRTIRHNTNRP